MGERVGALLAGEPVDALLARPPSCLITRSGVLGLVLSAVPDDANLTWRSDRQRGMRPAKTQASN